MNRLFSIRRSGSTSKIATKKSLAITPALLPRSFSEPNLNNNVIKADNKSYAIFQQRVESDILRCRQFDIPTMVWELPAELDGEKLLGRFVQNATWEAEIDNVKFSLERVERGFCVLTATLF